MTTQTNNPPKPYLGFGTRVRKSPYFESTLKSLTQIILDEWKLSSRIFIKRSSDLILKPTKKILSNIIIYKIYKNIFFLWN